MADASTLVCELQVAAADVSALDCQVIDGGVADADTAVCDWQVASDSVTAVLDL